MGRSDAAKVNVRICFLLLCVTVRQCLRSYVLITARFAAQRNSIHPYKLSEAHLIAL